MGIKASPFSRFFSLKRYLGHYFGYLGGGGKGDQFLSKNLIPFMKYTYVLCRDVMYSVLFSEGVSWISRIGLAY